MQMLGSNHDVMRLQQLGSILQILALCQQLRLACLGAQLLRKAAHLRQLRLRWEIDSGINIRLLNLSFTSSQILNTGQPMLMGKFSHFIRIDLSESCRTKG